MIPASDALQRLREGNQRFLSGTRTSNHNDNPNRRGELVAGQQPFAIILGCSDSRVPAEVIFDQGLGDLFVVRVAGNIAAPSQIGSIEYAAQNLGSRLIVVLGHSQCGAVSAMLEALQQPSESHSSNLQAIIDRIRPAVEGLADPETQAVRANVRESVNRLCSDSEVLSALVRDEGLLVVGAEYSLETGVVEFLD